MALVTSNTYLSAALDTYDIKRGREEYNASPLHYSVPATGAPNEPLRYRGFTGRSAGTGQYRQPQP